MVLKPPFGTALLPSLRSRRSWLIPAMVLVAGLAITAVVAYRHDAANMRIAEEALNKEGNLLADALRIRIAGYGHGLRGIRGFFIGDPDAGRAKFRRYAESRDLAMEFPGAQGLGFVRHVPRESLAAFIAQRQRELGPNFTARTLGANTGAAFVIDYFEPSSIGDRVIGTDIGSEEARREAALRSMWSGEAALSAPLSGTVYGDAFSGFAYMLPIYRTDAPVATPQERVEAIFGWALMRLDMGEMFFGIASNQLDFKLYDLVEDREPRLILDGAQSLAGMAEAPASGSLRGLRKSYDFVIGGRLWRLWVSASPALWSSLNLASPWLTMAVGSLISLLLAAVLFLVSETGRRAEALAQRMTENLQLRGKMLDSLGEGVYTADTKGICTYINPAALSMLGFDESEVVGHNQHLLFHHHHPDGRPYPQEECFIGRSARDGQPRSGEDWFFRKGGNGFPIHYTCDPLMLGGKPSGVVVVFSDITEQKQLEKSLSAAKETAELASRAKSEFLASMSHELRTPLNAILGFSQLFGMDPDLPGETKENALQIERAGQHLLSLINDLIDLARIEAGKMEFSPEPVSVRQVLEDGLAMVAPIAAKQGIELIDESSKELEMVVRADYVRLRQVVINLLSNAIKYNRPHGTVRLSCGVEEGSVRISITDSGMGIPADKQSRIFTSFDRLGAERGAIEGAGIGLVITRRIVEAMGGTIGFDSVEGQGSTFWVAFPADLPGESSGREEAAPLAAAPASAGQTTRPVVLYVEDNPMNLRLMQQIFATRNDLELRDAPSAEIGLELARAALPALILMDINLPGMDGYEALAELRADPGTAHIPVIAVSANAMKGDAERGREAGFAAYFTKPIDIPALLATLDRLREDNITPKRDET